MIETAEYIIRATDKMTRDNYIDEIKLYIQPLIEKNAPYLADYFYNLISSSENIGYKPGQVQQGVFAQCNQCYSTRFY